MNCYKCHTPLTKENETVEHIIPNFLGGKITSTKLICGKCNVDFGSTIDKELHAQIGFAAELIVEKRHRKKKDTGIQVDTHSGKTITVGRKLIPKPKLTIRIPNQIKVVEITAENDDELRRIAKEKSDQLEVKFGEFKLTEFIEQPTPEKVHFKNSLTTKVGEIGFGGIEYLRGIGKIMLNFYLAKCEPAAVPTNLIEFVSGTGNKNGNKNKVFIYHPTSYKVHELGNDEFSHIIHVRGEKEIKALYCYVELFNFEKYICVLDDNFGGEDFEKTYCYDCIKNSVIDKKVTINIQRHHVEMINLIAHGHKKARQSTFNEFEKRVETLQDL